MLYPGDSFSTAPQALAKPGAESDHPLGLTASASTDRRREAPEGVEINKPIFKSGSNATVEMIYPTH